MNWLPLAIYSSGRCAMMRMMQAIHQPHPEALAFWPARELHASLSRRPGGPSHDPNLFR
jgi:hypothetical protein